jgi:hypothetical protein
MLAPVCGCVVSACFASASVWMPTLWRSTHSFAGGGTVVVRTSFGVTVSDTRPEMFRGPLSDMYDVYQGAAGGSPFASVVVLIGYPEHFLRYDVVNDGLPGAAPTIRGGFELPLSTHISQDFDIPVAIPVRVIWSAFARNCLWWTLACLAVESAVRLVIRARRSRRGKCLGCGYTLEASMAVCPECGRQAALK